MLSSLETSLPLRQGSRGPALAQLARLLQLWHCEAGWHMALSELVKPAGPYVGNVDVAEGGAVALRVKAVGELNELNALKEGLPEVLVVSAGWLKLSDGRQAVAAEVQVGALVGELGVLELDLNVPAAAFSELLQAGNVGGAEQELEVGFVDVEQLGVVGAVLLGLLVLGLSVSKGLSAEDLGQLVSQEGLAAVGTAVDPDGMDFGLAAAEVHSEHLPEGWEHVGGLGSTEAGFVLVLREWVR
jgi:hypothetical protein